MKVTTRGHEITEVPGVHSIVVEESPHAEHGVHVVIHTCDPEDAREPFYVHPRTYGLAELSEYVAALYAALDLGRNMAASFDAAPEH